MATNSSGERNLETLEENSKIKPKYTKTRSRAYRRKRAAKRRKQSIQNRKILRRYLNNKRKRFEMFESVRSIPELPTLIPQNSVTCQGDEAAFWKSKAISLQFENRMLHKHIEEIYSHMIESNLCIDYERNTENKNYETNENCDETEYVGDEEEICEEEEEVDIIPKKEDLKDVKQEEVVSTEPPVQNKKEREKEMHILYGQSFRKIMGMETVVQMKYEVTLDKEKINYWPVLPIKM